MTNTYTAHDVRFLRAAGEMVDSNFAAAFTASQIAFYRGRLAATRGVMDEMFSEPRDPAVLTDEEVAIELQFAIDAGHVRINEAGVIEPVNGPWFDA